MSIKPEELKPSQCTACLPWGFSETSDAARKKHCQTCAGTGLVYAIPDTHRVVSVETLQILMGSGDAMQSLDARYRVRAIIEGKPCSQS